MKAQKQQQRGFTLIELIIVVGIIGIIAGIGYPSYLDYVVKSRRSDGHLALMNAVQAMERCRSTQYSYANCALPVELQTSEEGNYAISVESDASTYELTATAQAIQATDDDCSTMTIDDKSVRGYTGDGPCW